jgi:hypothetical protein
MKRFRELIAEIRRSYPTDDFFADFENSCRREPGKKRHYRSYNEALMLLDDESWTILKKKAIEQFRNERVGQRKQGFFNQLNEAFAYRYLLRKGSKNVRFIKEGKKKTPDIGFVDRGTQSYCEVKTLGITDVEIMRREGRSVYDGSVYVVLNEIVLDKLARGVGDAWEQIHALGKSGLVFVVIHFDDIALDHYESYRKQLAEFCRSRGFEKLILKVGYRGNKRICI